MNQPRILFVDADPMAADFYGAVLASVGPLDIVYAADQAEAFGRLKEDGFDLIVAALGGQTTSGPTFDPPELAKAARAADRSLDIVFLGEAADAKAAGLKVAGAEYLARSFVATRLAVAVARLLEKRRLGAEHQLLRRQVERPYSFDDMIGASPPMQRVFATIDQIADSNVDVLVLGDTGTGKELVARALHRRSKRANGPFVPVDCGAIPESLLESELFGHERGAFTGADARRIGLLEFADGGTLFLDELGELPLALQAKLLRTLQERKIRRVGGREEVSVDMRLVAATARDLDAMVRQESFRQDLYYRINVVKIDLPPLRERGDDIGLLAEYFVHRHSREMGRQVNGLTSEAYQVLKQYSWPGNVRELQNIIRRGLALSKGSTIGLDDLPDELVVAAGQTQSDDGAGYFQIRDQHMARFEQQYLKDLLSRYKGDAARRRRKKPGSRAARSIACSRTTNLDSRRFSLVLFQLSVVSCGWMDN